MDTENMQQGRAIPRCRVCRLTPDALAEVHRQRLVWNATYEHLAQKLRSSGHVTSPSSLRRHFAHVRNSQMEDTEVGARNLEEIATPFDPVVGGGADDRAIADAVVNVLVEQLQHAEKVRRVTRDGAQADRFAARSLKQIAALDRALRRRQEIRKPRQELLAKFKDTLSRIAEAVRDAAHGFMQEHVGMMDRAVDQYLRDHSHPELLVRRLREFENDWPRAFASRILTALKGVSQDTLNSLK